MRPEGSADPGGGAAALDEALEAEFLKPAGSGRLLAIVGAGGKTSLLFRLAGLARARGLSVLACTTTRMMDPVAEGRALDAFSEDASWGSGQPAKDVPGPDSLGRRGAKGFLAVICPGVEGGKLLPVDSLWIGGATRSWDLVLVEADGARHLPLKAPAAHEPVMPPAADAVIAVMGLDALGAPLSDGSVFRPELVASICGGPLGRTLTIEDFAALAADARGAFKACPPRARRVIFLNKSDLVSPRLAALAAGAVTRTGAAHVVLGGSAGRR